MDYDHRITGQIIGLLRTQHNISQEVLSGLAGVARSHLTMIENGSKNPSVGTLWRLAAALDKPLSAIFLLIEEETARQEKHKKRNPAIAQHLRDEYNNIIP